jgi:hypothetical protein
MTIAINMTSEEYWRMFHLVRGDVETAIGCSSTYLTINRLAAGNYDILQQYNRNADFWRATTYALQTGLFMALGRMFDQTKNTYTIEDLAEQTIEHPGFFTKAELRQRKRESLNLFGNAPDPEWLPGFVANVVEPNRASLAILKTELQPHVDKFITVYEPIRHRYFAHRGKDSEQAIKELFEKTAIVEVAEILRFSYGLITGIQDMAYNGTLPGKWTSDKSYDSLFKEYEKSTEELVKGLKKNGA